eukprot:COSAG01_NODE_55885_length_322_cov_0.690583_1_plen_29_part_10
MPPDYTDDAPAYDITSKNLPGDIKSNYRK